MHALLQHVLIEAPCQDPDCELHNIDVAMAEHVVGPVEVAFYIAGMQKGVEEFDMPTVYEGLSHMLSRSEMIEVGAALEFCPVHFCDIRICEDDQDTCQR